MGFLNAQRPPGDKEVADLHPPASNSAAADPRERYVAGLAAHRIPLPGTQTRGKPATVADETRLYDVSPSFVDRLPWVEYLRDSKCLLLENGVSVAAFYELIPLGTKGRKSSWFEQARDAQKNTQQNKNKKKETN